MQNKSHVPNHQQEFESMHYMAVCQNLVPLVNIKIAGKWMFIPLKMVLIGIDPYPYDYIVTSHTSFCQISSSFERVLSFWGHVKGVLTRSSPTRHMSLSSDKNVRNYPLKRPWNPGIPKYKFAGDNVQLHVPILMLDNQSKTGLLLPISRVFGPDEKNHLGIFYSTPTIGWLQKTNDSVGAYLMFERWPFECYLSRGVKLIGHPNTKGTILVSQ